MSVSGVRQSVQVTDDHTRCALKICLSIYIRAICVHMGCEYLWPSVESANKISQNDKMYVTPYAHVIYSRGKAVGQVEELFVLFRACALAFSFDSWCRCLFISTETGGGMDARARGYWRTEAFKLMYVDGETLRSSSPEKKNSRRATTAPAGRMRTSLER